MLSYTSQGCVLSKQGGLAGACVSKFLPSVLCCAGKRPALSGAGRTPTSAAQLQHPQGGGFLDLLYDVPDMRRQLEDVEEGAGRAYLAWLAQARSALEVCLPVWCV